MIISIESTLPSFKAIRFHEGLNVLLSDSVPGASDRQTRNSAGKTSLIEVIHFLLGADCDKNSMFRSDALIEYYFTGTFAFGAEEISVQRSGKQPSRIYIVSGLDGREDLPIKEEKASGRLFISNTNWKNFLGHTIFDLPKDPAGTVFDQPGTPTFRSMIPYFVRRDNSGGFISPERQSEKQQRGDWQQAVSYLLGFDWQIPFEFQKIRARESALEELKKAAKGGMLGDVIGTVAELRSKVTVAERKATQRREQLANFQVLESYNELARRVARAKTEMQALSREIVSHRERLGYLEAALEAETPPDSATLGEMYSSVGIELPGVARRRLEDVQTFYQSIVQNRSLHLRQEITALQVRTTDCEQRVAELDFERREIMQTLESRGALEDFVNLQRELAKLEAEAANLRERFKAAEILEGEKTQLDIDRSNYHRRLQQDFHERKERLDQAILLVADAISDLYEDRSGGFEISATDNGPEFKITIEGDRGGGIARVEIFCFDMALFQVVSAEGRGPGFLVHDSHLFDGVDERQISRALQLGKAATEGKGLQYIVTMNSDIFNRLPLSEDIGREDVVLPMRLSDDKDTGGLFGFRFD